MRSATPKELIDKLFDRLDSFYDQRLSRLEALSNSNAQSMNQVKILINDLNARFSELSSIYLSPTPKAQPKENHDFKSFFDKIVQDSKSKDQIRKKTPEKRSISGGGIDKKSKKPEKTDQKTPKTPIFQKKTPEKGFKVMLKPNNKLKNTSNQMKISKTPLKDYSKTPLKNMPQRKGSEHSTDTTLQFKAENSEEVVRTELPAKSEYSRLENEIL